MIKICIPYYHEYATTDPGIKELRDAKFPFKVFYGRSPLVAQARNALVNNNTSKAILQDIGNEYTHYLFIDSDIGFTLADVESAMSKKKPIVCHPYLCHHIPDTYSTFISNRDGVILKRYTTDTKGFRQVTSSGTGFMLIETNVFSKLRYPWFRYGVVEQDGKADIVGEDIMFCTAVTKTGLPIFCDFDRPVYHRLRSAGDFI